MPNSNTAKKPLLSADSDLLDANLLDELNRQMHRMSLGIDAIECLSELIPAALDQEVSLSGDQMNGLLKCIEFSLLTTQREIVALIHP